MLLDELPTELIGEIMNFLDLDDVAMMQATSRRMRGICRDAVLWRDVFLGNGAEHECKHAALLRKQAKARQASASASASTASTRPAAHIRPRPVKLKWDPVFEGEPVSWYDEYIQRHGPIAVNWFELPLRAQSRGRRVGYRIDPADVLEVRGAALYWPSRQDENGGAIPALLAVSPLDDGSVCLWDVNGTVRRRGAIVQRSAPGLLFGASASPTASASSSFTATDCVSVDSAQHVGYFAVGASLVLVDLHTLQVVDRRPFAAPVTAVSAAHHSVPLTVGHDGGVCLYDPRQSSSASLSRVSNFPTTSPLSILHMPEPGAQAGDAVSHDIFVAGRVPTVFQYDRRHMAAPKDSIFSGATLCGLASLSYPHARPATGYLSGLHEVSELSDWPEPQAAGAPHHRTLIACGEYKSKGSLELYPIGPGEAQTPPSSFRPPEPMINRQTSSSAKILSVAAHGKRIVTSDGAGFVRWFERDGFREARRCEVSGGEYRFDSFDSFDSSGDGDGSDENRSAGDAAPTGTATETATEIVRKLLPTDAGTAHSNDVLLWTGEHLGLLTFSSRPGFGMDDFVEELQTAEERATEKKGFEYRAKMRQLFESARYFGEDGDSD